MVISVSNKGIHRYKYLRRKICFGRSRKEKDKEISFGEVFVNIQNLKNEGIISILSVDSSVAKAMKNYKCRNQIRK